MCEHNCWVRTPKAAKTEATKQKHNTKSNENINNKTETAHIFIRCHFGPLLFALVFAPYIYPAILHRRSHLAGFHCSSLLGRLFISLAMARKFFCGSCGHEVVHEVFEEGNCLSCRILLSRKLRSMSDGREPVSRHAQVYSSTAVKEAGCGNRQGCERESLEGCI